MHFLEDGTPESLAQSDARSEALRKLSVLENGKKKRVLEEEIEQSALGSRKSVQQMFSECTQFDD